jgi:type VII secretion protein EccE
MVQPPAPVRATARVEAAVPAAPGPAAALPLRRDPTARARNLSRLMLVQAVLLGALAVAATGGSPWAVAALAGLVGVTALALLRRRNRWWTQHLGIVLRYRRRRRASVLAPGSPLRALPVLVPELQVTDVPDAEGTGTGVARDATGWYAVAVVPPRLGPAAPVPLSQLARALADAEEAGVSLQVVVHTDPAPEVGLDPRQPCAASYRQLLELCGPVPAARTRWVVVRVDATALAEAAADGAPDRAPHAPELTAALLRRLGRVLERARVPYRILDAAGLVDALCHSLDLAQPAAGDPGGTAGREAWRAWHSLRLAHAGFWIRDWPAPAASGALLDRLATVPGAMTSVAVTVRPRADGYDLRGVARVATRPDDLRRACAALVGVAHQAGARLFRLDGEHAPAAYASAPTGGGAG